MGEIIQVTVTMPKRALTMELDSQQAADMLRALGYDESLKQPPSPALTLVRALRAIKEGRSF